MLRFYAQLFPVTEVNATYYRIPAPRSFAQMAAKTPPDFTFVVKAHRSATHDRHTMAEVMPSFLEAIQPLRDAGKFSGVLLQFPWGFKNTDASQEHLARTRDFLGDMSVFAEFRHDSWDRDEVYRFLEDQRVGYCAVDEPSLAGLMPPVVHVTSEEGYVRFHGRNATNWWGEGGGDRYDYRYSENELKEWVNKIRTLDERTLRTFVFFNNCHAGQAVTGARMLADLLGLDVGGPMQGEIT
jgi:uncharacterized protein YecE (DUF72 family)